MCSSRRICCSSRAWRIWRNIGWSIEIWLWETFCVSYSLYIKHPKHLRFTHLNAREIWSYHAFISIPFFSPDSRLRKDNRLWTGQIAGHQRRRVQSGRRQNAPQVDGARIYPTQDFHSSERCMGIWWVTHFQWEILNLKQFEGISAAMLNLFGTWKKIVASSTVWFVK